MKRLDLGRSRFSLQKGWIQEGSDLAYKKVGIGTQLKVYIVLIFLVESLKRQIWRV